MSQYSYFHADIQTVNTIEMPVECLDAEPTPNIPQTNSLVRGSRGINIGEGEKLDLMD